MANTYLFAAGHDQSGSMVALHTLSPPKFWLYELELKSVWHGEVERRMGGDLYYARIGLPWVEYQFPVLTQEELQLLRTTFFSSGALSVPVTIQTLNFDKEEVQIFNGVMHWPTTEGRDRANYRNVVLVVDQLDYLSTPS